MSIEFIRILCEGRAEINRFESEFLRESHFKVSMYICIIISLEV